MNKTIFIIIACVLICAIIVSIALRDTPEPVVHVTFTPPTISASSSVVVLFEGDQEKILFEKNASTERPLASITKLFTAFVSTTSDLFRPMLVYSSNEAAEKISTAQTITAMNALAREWRLEHTMFFNPSGKDLPGPNFSSAIDVARAIHALYKTERGKEILLIGREYTPQATNASLVDPRIAFKILGGKTGETPKAKQNLVLLLEGPDTKKVAIVVLGSDNRVEDMASLSQWTYETLYR